MRHLSQLDGSPGADTLIAAISFQDSLVYTIYNASEDDLPTIVGEIPTVSPPHPLEGSKATDAEKKFGTNISPSRVASNPINQMWIQGAPPIFINEAAPLKSRVLDALACAIRSSLDEAKSRQTKEEPITQSSRGRIISRKRKFLSDAGEAKDKSATEWAVEHHSKELSCRNLLAEASNLLKNEEESSLMATYCTFGGHRLLIMALGIILDPADREVENFQTQIIFYILEGIMERPMLLFQGGPTYHLINNCAIFLAHIINKLHEDVSDNEFAQAQFEVALDIYNGSRLVLEKHRSKLPNRLQCHGIPSPNVSAASNGEPVIDLSNVSLCSSRNCQDCIATGISAKELAERVSTNNNNNNRSNGLKSESEREFDVNDRALLAVLSRISQEEKL